MAASSLIRPWTLVLCAVGLVVIAATVTDYGVNWDEGGQARYGEAVVEYFRSGEKGWEVPGDFAKIRYYGGVFEAAAALAYESRPRHKYVVRHVFNALTALLCVVALMGSPAQTTMSSADVAAETTVPESNPTINAVLIPWAALALTFLRGCQDR